jgi:hypothetical protein
VLLTATEPSERLRELRQHRVPDARVASAFPGVDDSSSSIDEDEMRLVRRPEPAGACPVRVLDRLPRPVVALDERAGVVWRVRDVDPDVGDLRVALDVLGVGDRLALAGASPGRPDVDHDRAAAEVTERDRLAAERLSRQRRSRFSSRRRGRHVGARGRRLWRRRLLVRASAADSDGDGEERDGDPHRATVAPPAAALSRISPLRKLWSVPVRADR